MDQAESADPPIDRPGPSRAAVAALGALAFVMLFGYAMARPASESLFLETFGSKALPEVWITVAAAMVVAVALYNAAAARFELFAVMLGAIALAGATLVALLSSLGAAPSVAFLLYVWKDVHIVLLLECLWSFANLVFTTRAATGAYGLFCAAGSLGGISGNLAMGSLAGRYGTAQALWTILPVLALEALVVWQLARATGRPRPPERDRARVGDALGIVRRSAYLPHLLLLVGLVQVVITLVDYQYNVVIEKAYPLLDARTAIIGRVYAVIDAVSLALQLATGAVLGTLGLRAVLLGIPAVLGAALGWFALMPAFLSMAVVKVASKALDYSLFRAAKEMLYIPLSYADKTRGKALVDMLTYRVAKGGASLVLVMMVGLGLATVMLVTGALLVAWGAVTWAVLRRYRRLTT
jgi:AAA family ATP:ADP antiporter